MTLRYLSPDEDSARWQSFAFRNGDVVVSTRSKTGTTWVQQIIALLLTGEAQLSTSLGTLSPWVDHLIEPMPDVVARLDAQRHRRVVKTHTPLDGIELDPRATYVVVGRHPLDAAVSMYHQGNNIDRARLAELTGATAPTSASRRPGLHDWLVAWTRRETTAQESMDSLVGHLHHGADAWQRREADNVVLLHYADLSTDLAGCVAGLAERLQVPLTDARLAEVVTAAGFGAMSDDAARAAPNAMGVLRDPVAFFRNGRSGEGRATLSAGEYAAFQTRCEALASDEVLAWLLR